MNWLAHLYLSEGDVEFRVGNLLPDWVGPSELVGLPEGFQRGIARHRRIDAFTDAHPMVRRSVRRFEKPFRRFGSVLTDVFYDHFLAAGWCGHCAGAPPLGEFVSEFYESVDAVRERVPAQAWEVLEHMRRADWLGSYATLPGIEMTLRRMSRRLRRPFDLAAAVEVLEKEYEGFREDFEAFFPEVRRECLCAQ
ncbi:ACP phosphodiesterase [Prosthecobacter sp.]|uniref:acyl carrier protein phosphodiesterase n=1 Tax=Prosthecobacter sp. TaxID=1965333 RepID=UPI0037844792